MTKRVRNVRFVIGIILFCCVLIFQNAVFAAKTLTLNYDGKTVKYSGITYSITIDGKQVTTDLPGIVFNKSVMFPLRAVFETLGGKVVWNSKTQIMDITCNGSSYKFTNNSASVKINGKTIKMSYAAKKINDRLIVPVDFLKNVSGLTSTVDSKLKIIKITRNSVKPTTPSNTKPATPTKPTTPAASTVGTVQQVSSVNSGEKTVITLKMNNSKGYNYYRLTDPNRIAVNFKNVKSDARDFQTDSDRIDGINITPVNSTEINVIINLKEMANFTVESIQGGCKITVEKPVNTKLQYENSYDRVYFSIQGIKLADVNSTIKKYFSEQYDEDTFKYTITIASSSAISLADDDFNINDSRVKNVQILRDKETNDTKIIINAKKEFTYFTSYNDKRNQTEINLLTPAKDGETLVVIDAGHGGLDPGAVYAGVNEKDLNLAIALKLEKLLKAQKIKTFMLRQDDTFVGLYDRPYIANALNATLFLCIHNNYIDSQSASGTETLYYHETPGDPNFTGQKFAKLVQDNLISKLKSKDRKTVQRDGLVVLKYTHMPAALAEIGFLSNPAELKNLTSSTYQDKVAEALRDAVVKALGIIDSEQADKQTNDGTDINSAENGAS